MVAGRVYIDDRYMYTQSVSSHREGVVEVWSAGLVKVGKIKFSV